MERTILLGILTIGLLLSFSTTKASTINATFCNPGSIIPGQTGTPPLVSEPAYDYGADGLVRFHFKMLDAWSISPNHYYGAVSSVTTTFFDSNCQVINTSFLGDSFSFPNVPNLILKAEPLGNNMYHFLAYDEDTGQPANFSAPLANVSGTDVVQLKFTVWPNSTAAYYGIGQETLKTPAVSVTGSVVTSNSRTPVLFIPGVLGTNLYKGSDDLWVNLDKMATDIGDNFMDPLAFQGDLKPLDQSVIAQDIVINPDRLFNYSEGLTQEFLNQGYKESTSSDATLFTFPYDWRFGISQGNEDALKQKIQDILTQTGADKVDVVAHSTGGLILKKYIEDNQDSHIGKAVFVAVPNLGAPKAIKVLLQGDNFGIPWLADSEIQKIGHNLPVIYDLAPSEQYYENDGSFVTTITTNGFGSVKQKLNFDQVTKFLTNDHNFNTQAWANAQALHSVSFENEDLRTAGVDVYSIIGCKTATIGNINENLQETVHGPVVTGYSTNNISGDGTVPMASAQSIITDSDKTFYAIKADHSKMPSQDGIRQEIVNIISGSVLDTGKNIITQDQLDNNPSQCQLKGHWWQIFSPLSIQVTDQDGNIAQVAGDGSIQNDIPGASYEVWGDHKFVFVPTDEGQTYTVNLKGTGDGSFTLKDETIDNGQVINTQVFSNVPVSTALSGNLNLTDSATTLALDSNGDGVLDETIAPTSVINADESLDMVSPSTTPVITGTQDAQGNYIGNVTVDFSATDPVVGEQNETSGVLATHYSLDGTNFVDYASSSPISVTVEGQHVINFFSTDRAGNNEQEQTLQFTIQTPKPPDQTSPTQPSAPPPSAPSSGGGGPPPVPPAATSSPVTLVLPTPSTSPSATSSEGSVLGASIINNHMSGTLVLFSGDPTVYFINQNSKHPFYSAQDFLTKGYQFKNVLSALPGDALLPLGMVM